MVARADIDGLTVMGVRAEHAVEELIADRDADQAGARIQQSRDDRRGLRRRSGMGIEIWIAVGNLAALDGKQVLHHEGEAGERAIASARNRLFERVRDQGADRVVLGNGDEDHLALLAAARLRENAI